MPSLQACHVPTGGGMRALLSNQDHLQSRGSTLPDLPQSRSEDKALLEKTGPGHMHGVWAATSLSLVPQGYLHLLLA
jgi:hypothetical protein